MNLLARKLQLFSLAVCSTFMAVTSVPQVISADPSSAKLSGIKEIVATSGFWGGSSFALGTDGTVWSWGSNVFGQFANGTAGPEGWTITPHSIAALDRTKQLEIGGIYYVALNEDGTVKAWGDYRDKNAIEAGNGVSAKQHKVLLPQVISGMTDVVSIASGMHNTLALRKDGSVLQWNPPEITDVGFTVLPAATKVQGLSEVMWVGNSDYQAAIRTNGTLWIWSANPQIENTKAVKKPTPVKDLYHVKSVSMNWRSILALTETGSVWATVDSNNYNEIMIKKMPGLTDIVSVQTKNGFNLVANKKGEYWVWKAGTLLQGLQKITVIKPISKLTLDLGGFVAVKKDGTAWTWNTQSSSDSKWVFTKPKQIKGLSNPVSFATGENSKYAVLKDGTAVAWGTNMFGQLGISALDSRPFTVSPILKPVTVIVDGKKIDSAQSAIFLDGSVRVPIREVAENLGYTLSWDGDMTLSKEGKKIIFKEGAIKVSYASLVPAAALVKALGVTAEWNSKLYQLTIQTKR
ncbi:stalk domain-containing protein [Paenibacillus sp. FSL R5-0475]|uniref:stalk domain-containing protein n=1 Tax=Paenibacillus sp. FSL R5-0475 TaxID=2921643 RepID=UPI0030F6C30A